MWKHRTEDPPPRVGRAGRSQGPLGGEGAESVLVGGCLVATVGPATLCCPDSSSQGKAMLEASRRLWLSRQEMAGPTALPSLCPGAPVRTAPHSWSWRHWHLPKPLRGNNDSCAAARPLTQGTSGAHEVPSRGTHVAATSAGSHPAGRGAHHSAPGAGASVQPPHTRAVLALCVEGFPCWSFKNKLQS